MGELLKPRNILSIRSGITDVSFDDFNRKYQNQICKGINTILVCSCFGLHLFASVVLCLQMLSIFVRNLLGSVCRCLQMFHRFPHAATGPKPGRLSACAPASL
jgi:hypothetical protein